ASLLALEAVALVLVDAHVALERAALGLAEPCERHEAREPELLCLSRRHGDIDDPAGAHVGAVPATTGVRERRDLRRVDGRGRRRGGGGAPAPAPPRPWRSWANNRWFRSPRRAPRWTARAGGPCRSR